MGTTATIVYQIGAVGMAAASLQGLVVAAPLPLDMLSVLGLRVTADATPVANPVVRTIVLAFEPSAPATATPVLASGQAVSLTVTAPGLDYVAPPAVRLVDPAHTGPEAIFRAYLKVISASVPAGGVGYAGPTTVSFLGGLPPADKVIVSGCVRQINVKDSGRGYAVGTTCSVEGASTNQATAVATLDSQGRVVSIAVTDMGSGYVAEPKVVLAPPAGSAPPTKACIAFAIMAEGTPARGTVTTAIGVVTGIVVTDQGDGYVSVPNMVVSDPAGVGAVVVAQMGVGRVDVVNPGVGYAAAATVVFTSRFKALFPDPSLVTQGLPFWSLVAGAIAKAAITPVQSDAPVVA